MASEQNGRTESNLAEWCSRLEEPQSSTEQNLWTMPGEGPPLLRAMLVVVGVQALVTERSTVMEEVQPMGMMVGPPNSVTSPDLDSLLGQSKDFLRAELARQLSLLPTAEPPTSSLPANIRQLIQEKVCAALPSACETPLVSAPVAYAEPRHKKDRGRNAASLSSCRRSPVHIVALLAAASQLSFFSEFTAEHKFAPINFVF
ncbi:hypothetical protein HPB50_009433 [Hyalomma asiaticum]|uniref:Uncharacterized protein n=1 Tax=Hyalomma asiaticum TaxID=266040 RepID=A0ACB7S821_HYAAI|nr:hypothetical protein HPB50_009433 [Hyalomma asiaticum]